MILIIMMLMILREVWLPCRKILHMGVWSRKSGKVKLGYAAFGVPSFDNWLLGTPLGGPQYATPLGNYEKN